MKYGSRRPVVLQVREPSMGMIQLGKIAPTPQGWAYFNNISAQMRKTAEYAVAPCVVTVMTSWNVKTIHYYDADTNRTYTTDLASLVNHGSFKSYGKRPPYWHLHISKWWVTGGKIWSAYVDEMLQLDWLSLGEAQPEQLAFSI